MARRRRRRACVADLRRDAVGAVEEGRAFGDLVERFDEDGAAPPEPLDDVLVVDDLVVDVERRPEELEGPFEALDRHVDPGAEAAGIRQDDLPFAGSLVPRNRPVGYERGVAGSISMRADRGRMSRLEHYRMK